MKHTVSEVKLGNGARGLLINVPDASVMSFLINFRAGEYLVEKDKWETPHLMEHVLLGANELIPKARLFQAEFEKNGAYSNASTSSYDIVYEAECADFEWDRIAQLLSISISKPLFLEEEFKAEFGNVIEELSARSNNHFRELSLNLREKFGYQVLTDAERLTRINNVELGDIVEHYKTTHNAKNMRFVIAGKLTRERIKIIKNIFEDMEIPVGESRLDLPNETPKLLKQPLYLENETVENIYFYIDTFTKRRMSEMETDSLNLVNSMLTETLHSKILGTAREKGLVYHLSSGVGQTKISSNWWFGAQVMPKNTKPLFKVIIKELEDVFNGNITEDEIVAVKQYSLGKFQRSGQTVGGTANRYAYRYFFDEFIDDYFKIPERIESVNKDKIVDIARAMFADNIWGLGVLGSCGQDFIDPLHSDLSVLWSK
ncbi:MAG: pitrilysin family protein [Candidatus Saccharimonadales bacterium]